MIQQSSLSYAGKRIRIFIGEAEEWKGKPLYRALLDVAQYHDVVGAIVLRGIEGFGPQHHLSTERLPDISDNLPIIVEIVEREERIHDLLPELDSMVQKGMITISPVEIIYDGRSV